MQRGHRLGGEPEPVGDDARRNDPVVVEKWLSQLPSANDDEQRRHIRRLADVLDESLGHRHRRGSERTNDTGLAQHVAMPDRRQARRGDL